MTIKQRIFKLLAKLSKISKAIDEIVKKIVMSKDTSSAFWNMIQRELNKQYEKARKVSSIWIDESIPIVYRDQIRESLTSIKDKRIPDLKKINYRTFVNKDINKQSLASIISTTKESYFTGFLQGQRTVIRLSRLTQQLNVNEKQIAKQIAEGFIERGTPQESIKRLRKELLKKSLDGKTITVINKNGKPMDFSIKYYAELVARTKLNEASTQATINTINGVGGDLIQISAHNTETPYDAQFEGKIYSLSGNDPDFPKVKDLPPFHPNCLHTTHPVFRAGLKVDGTLEKYIEFSKGETEIHPTKKSHIPISERGFEEK